MTPHQRAKKAAMALDLYERALNAAMEVVRDARLEGHPFYPWIANDVMVGHQAYRALRREAEAQAEKEGTQS